MLSKLLFPRWCRLWESASRTCDLLDTPILWNFSRDTPLWYWWGSAYGGSLALFWIKVLVFAYPGPLVASIFGAPRLLRVFPACNAIPFIKKPNFHLFSTCTMLCLHGLRFSKPLPVRGQIEFERNNMIGHFICRISSSPESNRKSTCTLIETTGCKGALGLV